MPVTSHLTSPLLESEVFGKGFQKAPMPALYEKLAKRKDACPEPP